MIQLSAIALDDEPPALRILHNLCAKTEGVILEKTFTSPSEVKNYLQTHTVDLLFLDINMPTVSGIDFYQSLAAEGIPQPLVIFTTAFSEFAIEGFHLQAVDYLLKPIDLQRFRQACQKAFILKQSKAISFQTAEAYLHIRADYTLHKIPYKDILFIEASDDYLKIYLQDQKPLVARMTMKALAEKLPPNQFMRVHKSYIVALAKVQSVRNRLLALENLEVPIGQRYEKEVLAYFT